MKILWCGDAVVSSGFSRCTHAACDAMHAAGHEVHVLGLNYFGDPHEYPYRIWPCRNPFDGGRDAFGATRLPVLVDRLRPDVVVILNDPWNVPAYLAELKAAEAPEVPVVAWLAVDAKNQRGEPLNNLAAVVTWTRFGEAELRRGGYKGPCSVVPLGVERTLFHPRDRAASRAEVMPGGFRPDAFVVGVVGRNQQRKRLDLALQAFAEWTKGYGVENAYLYFHVAPTADRGVDITMLTRWYGLQGKVILASPPVGMGIEAEVLPLVYSSFDALLTTTQGEGWGLTTMEAMACGVPCIVPDWSALGEWTEDAALKVRCTSTALSAPLNTLAYTIGGIPDLHETVEALHLLYTSEPVRRLYAQRGLALTARPEYQWRNVGTAFLAALEATVPGITRREA